MFWAAASDSVHARSGVIELVDEARAAGLKLAVCSAATKSSVAFCIENLLGRQRYEVCPVLAPCLHLDRLALAASMTQRCSVWLGWLCGCMCAGCRLCKMCCCSCWLLPAPWSAHLQQSTSKVLTGPPRKPLAHGRQLLLQALDCFLAGDDIPAKKPDPSIYKIASERLGVKPENCLVIEDSKIGLQAS